MLEWRVVSPRDVALRILALRSETDADTGPTIVPLADFQREAVASASVIIGERNGVLIADSVGLGKTFTALGLIEVALGRSESIVVIAPAALRRMWRRELRRIGESVPVFSHTQLARGVPPGYFDLVVVDEAHAFRNPQARRYRALKQLCRGSRVVLLTATPINNSLSDLYFQLRLFCSDSAFRDIGIGSLRTMLRSRENPSAVDLARLRRAVTVHRTRAEVRSAAPPEFRFPGRVETEVVGYDLPHSIEALRGFLERLCFSPYQSTCSPELLRFGLLKRMESSLAAIRTTVQRQIRFYEEFVAALERGMLVRPRSFRSLYDVNEDSLQLVLEGIALEPAIGGQPALFDDARRDLQTLQEWSDLLRRAHDDKLRRLITLLEARPAESKTIVFSEYRDTAVHIWRALVRRFPTGLIHGSAAFIGENVSSRREVVERFAPIANSGRAHPREAIRILVATDVLAEGMNLQDADAVISYDLPWNPVRLIQRAGRVDRLGSEHDVIRVYNFLPDREFDALLGLARTIRTKLETVRTAVGLERPVLEPDGDFEEAARAIAANRPGLLENLEAGGKSLRFEVGLSRPPPINGVPIARLSCAGQGAVLIALARGKWVELVSTAPDADALLREALTDECVRPLDVDRYAEIIESCVNSFHDSRLGSKSAAARVARLIRLGLAELPVDQAAPELYDLSDEVLLRLSGRLEIVQEEMLELIARHPPQEFAALLERTKNALHRAGNWCAADPGWRVAGALILD